MPEDTSQENRCPQCSRPLGSGSPRGLCPACLLACGLASNTVGGSAAGGGSARWTPPAAEQLAPLFPDLDILELIGRGGMGAVYKARQKELDRIVALKILPPEIGADPTFAQRFAREAQAMAKLSHPNIVTIYDFGQRGSTSLATGEKGDRHGPNSGSSQSPFSPGTEHSDGTAAASLYFFIMEYIDGLSLRQLLDRGTVNPKEALAIVPQICEALQYAHDRGIVHRDIKPENILLNRAGQVKIADFGLAKLVGQTRETRGRGDSETRRDARPGESAPVETQAASATAADARVMGTPQYMAPEQFDRPGEVDHRADIYSLGVVFYQMLTGELPKGRPGSQFEPPSRKVLIDVRLDEVVLRALEREPARRYQQVSEVRTQVETIVASPVAGQPQRPTNPPSSGVGPPPHAWPAANTTRISPPGAPPELPNTPSQIEKARQDVKAPAIGMIVAAGINLAVLLAVTAIILMRIVLGVVAGPIGAHDIETVGMSVVIVLPLLLGLSINCLILLGAMRMMRLRNRGLSITAAILAMLAAPGSLIGLPMGIWALVVLARRDIIDAFAAARRRPAQPSAPPATTEEAGAQMVTYARQAVRVPAIGLMVTGAIHLGLLAVVVVAHMTSRPPHATRLMWSQLFLCLPLLFLVANVFILLAASGMRQLRNHGAAVVAGILVILPLASPLGLIFGIWALVVLSRREIIDAFAAVAAQRNKPPPPVVKQGMGKDIRAVTTTVIVHFLLLVGLLALLVIGVEKFKDMTARMGVALPEITQTILNLSDVAQKGELAVLIVLAAADAGFVFVLQIFLGAWARRVWLWVGSALILLAAAMIGIGIYIPMKSMAQTIEPSAASQPAEKGHSIGIYLITGHPNDIPLDKTPLGAITLAAEPLISERDMYSYDWESHTIRLKQQAVADRILNRKGAGEGFQGFVVVVDGQRLYRGAMISVLTSIVPKTPVINVGPTAGQFQPAFAIRIYPPPLKGSPDPRGDARLKRALQALLLMPAAEGPEASATAPAVSPPGNTATSPSTQAAVTWVGPIERVLQYDRRSGLFEHDAVRLADGLVSTLPAGFFHGGEEGNGRWLNAGGARVFPAMGPIAGGSAPWGIGLAAHHVAFAVAPAGWWDHPPTEGELNAKAADVAGSGLEQFKMQGAVAHLIPDNDPLHKIPLPVTMAFAAADGTCGLIQIVSFPYRHILKDSDPLAMTIRYKLSQSSQAAHLEWEPSPELRPKAPMTADQVIVENVAVAMLAATRDKDDAALKALATDRINGWRDAVPQFAREAREGFAKIAGAAFDMRVVQSIVSGDLAAVKCAGPKELSGTYLALVFGKTDAGWKNVNWLSSPPSAALETHLRDGTSLGVHSSGAHTVTATYTATTTVSAPASRPASSASSVPSTRPATSGPSILGRWKARPGQGSQVNEVEFLDNGRLITTRYADANNSNLEVLDALFVINGDQIEISKPGRTKPDFVTIVKLTADTLAIAENGKVFTCDRVSDSLAQPASGPATQAASRPGP